LVVLSLLAIASATTPHALSEIAGAVTTVTVTATYPDAGTAPVLTALTYTTTYDSSPASPALFTIAGTATFSSVNNTVAAGSLILTNGGDTVTVGIAVTGITGLTATLVGGGYPKFLNTGNYAASVVLVSSLLNTNTVTLSSGAFPAVAATKYTPPTLSAFNLVSPQSGGCDATSCANNLNGTLTLSSTTQGTGWYTFLRSSHAAQGVVFATEATVTAGASNFNSDTNLRLATSVGGTSNGVFTPTFSGVSSNTHIPSTSNDNFAISGLLIDTSSRYTYFSEATVGAKQASVQINTASADITAPTCTVLTVAPTTVTTVDTSAPVTVTLTCADETGGSGLWLAGFFGTASVTSGTPYSFAVSHSVAGTYVTGVPPYVTGTLSVVGVWAIDNAGNAALYGSCGSTTGYDTVCGGGGGGSSSASTVAFSLFSVLLAVLVLFA